MSILLEAAGVGQTYSCRDSIQIPADGGRFVAVACEFVFHRRSASYVDDMVKDVRATAKELEDGEGDEDDAPTLIELVLTELVSMTIKAKGDVGTDTKLEDPGEIREALDVAGVPMQVFSIWAGSHQKAKKGN